MGEMRRSKAGYDKSLGMIANGLRDGWRELVAAPLPEQLRRLVDQLEHVQRSGLAIAKQEKLHRELLNTDEPTDEAKQLLDEMRREVNRALNSKLCEKSGRPH
jgi:hypothetical protein